MQTVIAILIVATACVYAGWRVYGAFKRASDPCYGCAGCSLKAQIRRAEKEKCDRKSQKKA